MSSEINIITEDIMAGSYEEVVEMIDDMVDELQNAWRDIGNGESLGDYPLVEEVYNSFSAKDLGEFQGTLDQRGEAMDLITVQIITLKGLKTKILKVLDMIYDNSKN